MRSLWVVFLAAALGSVATAQTKPPVAPRDPSTQESWRPVALDALSLAKRVDDKLRRPTSLSAELRYRVREKIGTGQSNGVILLKTPTFFRLDLPTLTSARNRLTRGSVLADGKVAKTMILDKRSVVPVAQRVTPVLGGSTLAMRDAFASVLFASVGTKQSGLTSWVRRARKEGAKVSVQQQAANKGMLRILSQWPNGRTAQVRILMPVSLPGGYIETAPGGFTAMLGFKWDVTPGQYFEPSAFRFN